MSEYCAFEDHEFEECYYGLRCIKCDLFILDSFFSDDYQPETCSYCGKEYEDFDEYGCIMCDVSVRE